MKGAIVTVSICCAAMLGCHFALTAKPGEPKHVQEDIAALVTMQGKAVSECLHQLKSSDERQRWAAARELSKSPANLYRPEVHSYLAKSKNLPNSAALTLMGELVSQRTQKSEDEMASLLSSNPGLAPAVSANYLHGRDTVPQFENWLRRQTDTRVVRAMATYYSKSPSPLGRSLYSIANTRLKELS